MKYILSLLLTLGIFSQASAQNSKLAILKTTVGIKTIQGSMGTGFVVRSEKVSLGEHRNVCLTCAHVIGTGTFPIHSVEVFNYNEFGDSLGMIKIPCYFYIVDQSQDIAIGIFTTKHELPVAKLNLTNPVQFGDKLDKFGLHLGSIPRYDQGIVTASMTPIMPTFPETFRMAIFTIGGDSGGPVFRDDEIVGITQALSQFGLQKSSNIGYAIPIRKLKLAGKALNMDNRFSYEHTQKIPVLPVVTIKISTLRIVDEDI